MSEIYRTGLAENSA